jgi:hypothetical protein
MTTLNDPQLFRRRRIEKIVEEEAARAGSEEELVRTLEARLLSDPGLKEALVLAELEEMVVEELRALGAVEVEPGVWERPTPPSSAA